MWAKEDKRGVVKADLSDSWAGGSAELRGRKGALFHDFNRLTLFQGQPNAASTFFFWNGFHSWICLNPENMLLSK